MKKTIDPLKYLERGTSIFSIGALMYSIFVVMVTYSSTSSFSIAMALSIFFNIFFIIILRIFITAASSYSRGLRLFKDTVPRVKLGITGGRVTIRALNIAVVLLIIILMMSIITMINNYINNYFYLVNYYNYINNYINYIIDFLIIIGMMIGFPLIFTALWYFVSYYGGNIVKYNVLALIILNILAWSVDSTLALFPAFYNNTTANLDASLQILLFIVGLVCAWGISGMREMVKVEIPQPEVKNKPSQPLTTPRTPQPKALNKATEEPKEKGTNEEGTRVYGAEELSVEPFEEEEEGTKIYNKEETKDIEKNEKEGQ